MFCQKFFVYVSMMGNVKCTGKKGYPITMAGKNKVVFNALAREYIFLKYIFMMTVYI